MHYASGIIIVHCALSLCIMHCELCIIHYELSLCIMHYELCINLLVHCDQEFLVAARHLHAFLHEFHSLE